MEHGAGTCCFVGEGATRFLFTRTASQSPHPVDPLVTPRRALSGSAGRSLGEPGLSAEVKHGTVGGAVALDAKGHLAAATSTGGVADKLPGRVGDTPMVGAGTFADDARAASSATGVGENIIRVGLTRTAAEIVASGVGAQEAAERALSQLRWRTGGEAGLILLSPSGDRGIARTTRAMSWGMARPRNRLEARPCWLSARGIPSSAAGDGWGEGAGSATLSRHFEPLPAGGRGGIACSLRSYRRELSPRPREPLPAALAVLVVAPVLLISTALVVRTRLHACAASEARRRPDRASSRLPCEPLPRPSLPRPARGPVWRRSRFTERISTSTCSTRSENVLPRGAESRSVRVPAIELGAESPGIFRLEQPFHEEALELHEEPEVGDRGDDSVHPVADLVLEEEAAEERIDLALRLHGRRARARCSAGRPPRGGPLPPRPLRPCLPSCAPVLLENGRCTIRSG